MKIRQIVEAVAPKVPRGGHWLVVTDSEGGKRAQRIATVSGGYAYVDTGGVERDVIPTSDLTYIGHGGKGHMWKERM